MNARVSMAAQRFSVGLEEGADGGVCVHALTIPGCAAVAESLDRALEEFGRTLSDWLGFLESVGEPVPPRAAELDVTVDEWIRTGAAVGNGESRACFDADRLPLTADDADRGLRILGSLRGRLLPHVRRARDAELEALGTGEWTARRLLDELARAQWWTLTRLGASPLAEIPDLTVGRLDTAMALIIQHVAHLPEEARARSIVLDDEEWTPRKILRRELWLEWTIGRAALHALGAWEVSAP